MKTLQKLLFVTTLISLVASCKSATDPNQGLLNNDIRMQTMNTIANDSMMSKEMIDAMANSKTGVISMQHHAVKMMENQSSMMEMAKNNPDMMNNMMTAMMEIVKGDTSAMSAMIKIMMGNPQMMGMMKKMTGSKRMMGMDHMSGMEK